MSIWTSKPSTPAPRPGVPTSSMPKWSSKPIPASPVKELLQLSKRSNVETGGFGWALKSHKNRIYDKYKITGAEVDEFVKNAKKFGHNIEFKESRPLEKKLDISRRSNQNFKERVKSEKWLKLLRDPEIFKK